MSTSDGASATRWQEQYLMAHSMIQPTNCNQTRCFWRHLSKKMVLRPNSQIPMAIPSKNQCHKNQPKSVKSNAIKNGKNQRKCKTSCIALFASKEVLGSQPSSPSLCYSRASILLFSISAMQPTSLSRRSKIRSSSLAGCKICSSALVALQTNLSMAIMPVR